MTASAVRPSFTRVDLAYRAQEFNARLIFGAPAHRIELENTFGLTRQQVYFGPGSLFGLDVWSGALMTNRADEARTRTRARACYVLQACAPGQEMVRVRGVTPGARMLIQTSGVRRCVFLLTWLEDLAQRCNPTELSADFFEAKSLRVQGLIPERHAAAAIGFPGHDRAH